MHSHQYSVAFTVNTLHADPNNTTLSQLLTAMNRRMYELHGLPIDEALEAFLCEDPSNDPGLCSHCGVNPASELHPCPYEQELRGNETDVCDCCPECEADCQADI